MKFDMEIDRFELERRLARVRTFISGPKKATLADLDTLLKLINRPPTLIRVTKGST